MTTRIKRLAVLLAVICAFAVPVALTLPLTTVSASTNPFKLVCDQGKTQGSGESVACQDQNNNKDPLADQNGILKKITFIIATLGGIVSVIVIVVGAIRMIASNGEAEQIGRAKKTIMYAIIGLVVIAIGQIVIIFVLNRI